MATKRQQNGDTTPAPGLHRGRELCYSRDIIGQRLLKRNEFGDARADRMRPDGY